MRAAILGARKVFSERVMQENGIAPEQVTQIRGYADQQLRKKDTPEDPSNCRITVIVQYPPKRDDADIPHEKGEKSSEPPKHSEAPEGEAGKPAEH